MDESIETFTGRRFYPLNPRAEDICIEDIAHALSQHCRFNGHCRNFYSVAQHSVLVAELVPQALKLPALLHDAAEAYLPDLCRPIKGRFCISYPTRVEQFAFAEGFVAAEIAHAFDFNPVDFLSPYIADADLILLATEARDLMATKGTDWALPCKPLNQKIEFWSTHKAEMSFLLAFRKYSEGRAQ